MAGPAFDNIHTDIIASVAHIPYDKIADRVQAFIRDLAKKVLRSIENQNSGSTF